MAKSVQKFDEIDGVRVRRFEKVEKVTTVGDSGKPGINATKDVIKEIIAQDLPLPFSRALPFKFEPCRAVTVVGAILKETRGFSIDIQEAPLLRGCGDCQLRFSGNIDERRQMIHYSAKSCNKGVWTTPEHYSEPFPVGADFEEVQVTIVAGMNEFYLLMKCLYTAALGEGKYVVVDGDWQLLTMSFPLSLGSPYVGQLKNGLVEEQTLVFTLATFRDTKKQNITFELGLQSDSTVEPEKFHRLRIKCIVGKEANSCHGTLALQFQAMLNGVQVRPYQTLWNLVGHADMTLDVFNLHVTAKEKQFDVRVGSFETVSFPCLLPLSELKSVTFVARQGLISLHNLCSKTNVRQTCWMAFMENIKNIFGDSDNAIMDTNNNTSKVV